MAHADTLLVPVQYPTIQAAIDAAAPGDEIVVADGVYTGDGNRDIDFLGKAITVRSENGAANCIISCQGTIAENHRGFHFHTGEGPDSVVDGFTITNGLHGNYDNISGSGGGLRIQSSNPTISNCVITNCHVVAHTSSTGGGIAATNGSPLIKNCVVDKCTAAGGVAPVLGGGVYVGDDTLVIWCIFTGNSLGTGFTPDGGAIHLRGRAVLAESTLLGNSGGRGGAVMAGDQAWIHGCLVSGNMAMASNQAGGGGFALHDTATIDRCIVIGNTGGHANEGGGGGGVCRDQSRVTNCLIAGNSTPGVGGGVLCTDGAPWIANCTIVGNSAAEGGGVSSSSDFNSVVSTIGSSIIAGNDALMGQQLVVDTMEAHGSVGTAPSLCNSVMSNQARRVWALSAMMPHLHGARATSTPIRCSAIPMDQTMTR